MAKSRSKRRGSRLSGHLGTLVREIRIQAGESIKRAAPQLEVDYTYLSKIENGVVNPSADLLARLAAHYRMDRDTLFLAAGRLPPDIEKILQDHPQEVMSLLRDRFGHNG